MNKSSALHERAQIRARRTILTVLAAGVSLALVVPGASATTTQAAPVAASAPALQVAKKTSSKKVKPKLSVTRSSTRQVKGETRVKLTIKAKLKGKNLKGKARIYVDGKRVKTAKLKKGKATYKLSKKLGKGIRKIKVTVVPSQSTTTTTAGTVHPVSGTSKTVRVRVISQSAAIKKEALKHVGVRYRGGGTSPRTGFDCSGFVSYVYKKAGIAKLPRSSSAQRYAGKVVSRKKAKVGDIIWTPGHVGIYLGGNKQIDAPRPGKTIKVRSIWQKNPVFINV